MHRLVLALSLFAPLSASAAAARMMVVAANPLAAQAGLDMLARGGTAIDAAVAVQAVLGLVEPQASGLGGGALILTYDAKTRGVAYYDGREAAPAAAKPDLFIGADARPLPFLTAEASGRAVGVPGAMAALELAYKTSGHLPWADLFAPAIRLAEQGFPITPRVAKLVAWDAPRMTQPALHDYLLKDGPPAAGTLLKNPAYAATLRALASGGAAALLHGRIAADIVAAARAEPIPGSLTTDDLAAYQAKRRAPLCAPYRAVTVCTAAPPSAGGLILLQTLGLLQHFDMPGASPMAADTAFLIAEAERLAMADRDAYGADADYVPVPAAGLIARDYLTTRAQLIDPRAAMHTPRAGNPDWGSPPPPQPTQPEHGTSDVAIVDEAGNAVSMTTTIEFEFGAQRLVDGFLLNNELTDFSFRPEIEGRPVANAVAPGKRPRSSMAPAIVLDRDGHLFAVLGSAGGTAIPGYVVQAALGLIDWGMTPAEALALGHVGATAPDQVGLEAKTKAETWLAPLTALGEPAMLTSFQSGSSAILVTKSGLLGAADPRRDGAAAGR